MQMQHHFTVPAPIDVAWRALLDPERVAPCMPGARLTKAEGDEFAGSVKVKLGPISLMYKGTGAFSTVDADARRVVIDASGKDARGNGTAAASVTAVLTEEVGAAGSATAVQVDTDLKITGKPAQLGRGLISEVGGKILDQFAGCLAEQLAGAGAEPAAETEPAAGAESTAGAEAAAADTGGERAAESSAGGAAAGGNGQRSAREGGRAGGSAAPVGKAPGWRVTPVVSNEESAAHEEGAASTPGDQSTDGAIDLLDTAGTPVLKRLLPLLAAFAAAGVLVVAIRRRRR